MFYRFEKIRLLVSGVVLAFLLLVPCLAFAADNDDAFAGDGASTGTLIAAALETAGYKAQSFVLGEGTGPSSFNSTLMTFGALLYVISIISAIATVALNGKYEMALWFFIGPAMFSFVTSSRVQATGSEWQFGNYSEGFDEIRETLDESVNANVSWLFHRYNRLISNLIQQGITIITHEESKKFAGKFTSRQRILDDLLRAKPEDPGLLKLSKFTLASCEQEMTAARLESMGNRDEFYRNLPEYQQSVVEYRRTYTEKQHTLRDDTKRYARRLLRANVRAGSTGNSSNEPTVYRECITETSSAIDSAGNVQNLLKSGVSCEQLWCWMGLGYQVEALKAIKRAESEHIPENMDDETKLEIWKEIAARLTDPQQLTQEEVRQLDPDLSMVPLVIGGYMLRQSMNKDLNSNFLTSFADHANVEVQQNNFSTDLTDPQAQKVGERDNLHQKATSEEYELYTFAMTIPYIQGALLYALSLGFPFFALLLLIPGKAGAFASWFALWAWVKCWDLGWAIVMVIDDVLWNFMPHHSYLTRIDGTNNSSNPGVYDPVSIFEIAFQGDPAYSLAGYYMLLGVLITGVPILSGQFVLGSKRALGGVLIDGLKGLGQSLGGSAANYVAVQQAMKYDYFRERRAFEHTMAKLDTAANQQVSENQAEGGFRGNIATGLEWAGYVAMGVGVASFVLGTGGLGGIAVAGVGAVSRVGMMTAARSALRSYGAKVLAKNAGVAAAKTAGRGALVTGGWISHKKGIDTHRVVNEFNFDTIAQNARLHYADYRHSREFMLYENMRGQVSNRMEYWNAPDLPTSVYADLNKQKVDVQANTEKIFGETVGNLINVAVAKKTFGASLHKMK